MARQALYSLGKVKTFVLERRMFYVSVFRDIEAFTTWLERRGGTQLALDLNVCLTALKDHLLITRSSEADQDIVQTIRSLVEVSTKAYHYLEKFLIAHPVLLDILTLFSDDLIRQYTEAHQQALSSVSVSSVVMPHIHYDAIKNQYITSEGPISGSEFDEVVKEIGSINHELARLKEANSILLKQIYHHNDFYAARLCQQGRVKKGADGKHVHTDSEKAWEAMQRDLFDRIVVHRWVEARFAEKALVSELDAACSTYQDYLEDRLRLRGLTFSKQANGSLTINGVLPAKIKQVQAKYGELSSLRELMKNKKASLALKAFQEHFQSADCQRVLRHRCDSYVDIFLRRISYLFQAVGLRISDLFLPSKVKHTQRSRIWQTVTTDRQHLNRLEQDLITVRRGV